MKYDEFGIDCSEIHYCCLAYYYSDSGFCYFCSQQANQPDDERKNARGEKQKETLLKATRKILYAEINIDQTENENVKRKSV